MLGSKRRTIGVLISQVNQEFQDNLSKGIITKAKELDYNVAFFTNFGGYGQPAYDIGEAEISRLPNYEELDGIIIAPDTLALQNLEHVIRKISTGDVNVRLLVCEERLRNIIMFS